MTLGSFNIHNSLWGRCCYYRLRFTKEKTETERWRSLPKVIHLLSGRLRGDSGSADPHSRQPLRVYVRPRGLWAHVPAVAPAGKKTESRHTDRQVSRESITLWAQRSNSGLALNWLFDCGQIITLPYREKKEEYWNQLTSHPTNCKAVCKQEELTKCWNRVSVLPSKTHLGTNPTSRCQARKRPPLT